MTMTAAATAMVAVLATAMGGAQTTIKLSYRNGGGCSWGQRQRRWHSNDDYCDDNDNDGSGDGDGGGVGNSNGGGTDNNQIKLQKRQRLQLGAAGTAMAANTQFFGSGTQCHTLSLHRLVWATAKTIYELHFVL
jgi:hypothetical protein